MHSYANSEYTYQPVFASSFAKVPATLLVDKNLLSNSEDPDQTMHMCSLICVFTVRIHERPF